MVVSFSPSETPAHHSPSGRRPITSALPSPLTSAACTSRHSWPRDAQVSTVFVRRNAHEPTSPATVAVTLQAPARRPGVYAGATAVPLESVTASAVTAPANDARDASAAVNCTRTPGTGLP